jgi:hypothetical protein
MAIGWLAVLKSVPWSEVIGNAPKVADGARKLWSAVARKASPPTAAAAGSEAVVAPEPGTLAGLEARTFALENSLADVHSQMLASSELIKALAEQNAQLIQRIEATRLRLFWLSLATAVLAIAGLGGLILALSRHGA